MKITNNESVSVFDFRTYKGIDPDVIKYQTSEREIWYGNKKNSDETYLKIKYIFDAEFDEFQVFELLFDTEKTFQVIDWKNPEDLLKINRHVNLKIKELSIYDIIELIKKISYNNWAGGFKAGQNKVQNDLQNILGLKNVKS